MDPLTLGMIVVMSLFLLLCAGAAAVGLVFLIRSTSKRSPSPVRGAGSARVIWIVRQDESPDNTVLGVFEHRGEALAFAEEIAPRHPSHVITSAFTVPFRAGDGAVAYSSPL
jgi:hypothetical protein